MARKYDFISELYNRTCKTVVANPASWEAFLRSACYNYRLRFDEQLLVPVVDLKNGSGIRSLCVYQKLLIKAQTVVVASRAQKGFPARRVCNDCFAGSVIQLRDEVVFSCHRRTPPYRS